MTSEHVTLNFVHIWAEGKRMDSPEIGRSVKKKGGINKTVLNDEAAGCLTPLTPASSRCSGAWAVQ